MSAIRNVAGVFGRRLHDGRARGADGYAAFDPADLLGYLLAALDKLLGCLPSPDDGWDYLAWRPYFDLFGWRLGRHRAAVRDRLAARSGDAAKARVFCHVMFEAIDAGQVVPADLAGMYAERAHG